MAKAKGNGKGKRHTEYSYRFAHEVVAWKKQRPRLTFRSTAEYWDIPPGAKEGWTNPSISVVSRWIKSADEVARKAGEEERRDLAGAFGRTCSKRSRELTTFESKLARSLDKRRKQG